MGAPVVHFEIAATDLEPLQSFYSQLFGWDVQLLPSIDYGMVYTRSEGGIDGGIAKTDQSFVTVYVEVPDPAAALVRAEELGAKTIVPVTEVPGVVTFALFADPLGHPIGVVQGDGTSPARTAGGGAPVVHFAISSPAPEPLHAFYRDLFGWTVSTDNPMGYGVVDTGSPRGIRGGIDSSDVGHDYVTCYAAVPDVAATLARAEELGGTVAMPVTELSSEVTLAMFADPQGHVFGLVQG